MKRTRTKTKKLIFRTQFNNYNDTGKTMDQELITQPDQNMSIRELLDKHSRGLPITAVEQKGEYFETEIPRFDDITDMMEYKKMLSKKHKELNTQIKKEQAEALAKREADASLKIDKEISQTEG
jgi:hypothetical protein